MQIELTLETDAIRAAQLRAVFAELLAPRPLIGQGEAGDADGEVPGMERAA